MRTSTKVAAVGMDWGEIGFRKNQRNGSQFVRWIGREGQVPRLVSVFRFDSWAVRNAVHSLQSKTGQQDGSVGKGTYHQA